MIGAAVPTTIMFIEINFHTISVNNVQMNTFNKKVLVFQIYFHIQSFKPELIFNNEASLALPHAAI